MSKASTEVSEFQIDIPEDEIIDLKNRLARTRWPDAETPDGWSQGLPLEYHQAFCKYWETDYDWYKSQKKLNQFPQFKSRFDGIDIHFVHVQSKEMNARPLIITHGWPGSIVEFQKVIEPLTDPVGHGGKPEDAFHVICPSLPGFGFSDKPTQTGWGVIKIAEVWNQLMLRLGYDSYFAQGGDWGSAVTTMIGLQNLGACKGIHVNMPSAPPTKEALSDPDNKDKKALAAGQFYQQWDSGYSKQQATRPQTLGYGLSDSPSGQAGWVLEKFYAWTDCNGHPENVLSRDELLDNIMLYWLPNNGASSARLYWESFAKSFGNEGTNGVQLPTGCSIFPKEIIATPRPWAEQRYKNIQYWNELDKGGHFAAFEQPGLFVEEMRKCFATLA